MLHTVMAGKLLKIGEVASRSGLPVKTIRYYEELGLLSPVVVRSDSGYRLFHPQVLKRLDFIKRSQSLGLKLKEIQAILGVYDQGQLPCGEVKQVLEEKMQAIAQQIAALETLRDELQTLLSGWQEQPPIHRQASTICPNIQSEMG
jgi:MerR family transcriptional regulator, copper efflux regulator